MPDLTNIHEKFFPKAKTVGTGKFLIKFAWAIEILVALTALTLSYIMLLSGSQANTELNTLSDNIRETNTDTIILGIAFVVVAVMELTKIPLATALYYSARIKFRILFFIALFAVNFSTFETMIQAFELNYFTRSVVVIDVKTKIDEVNAKIETFQKEGDTSSLLSDLSDVNSRIAEIDFKISQAKQEAIANETALSSASKDAIDQIREQLSSALSNLQDDGSNSEDRINVINNQISEYKDDISNNKKEIIGIERNIRNLEKRRDEIQPTLFGLSQAKQSEKNAIVRQIKDQENKIKKLEQKNNEKEDKIEELIKRRDTLSSTSSDSIKSERNRLSSDAEDSIARERESLRQKIETSQAQLAIIVNDFIKERQRIEDTERDNIVSRQNAILADNEIRDENLRELNKELDVLIDEYKNVAKYNSMYRLAEKINVIADWFSDEEGDLREEIAVKEEEKINLEKSRSEIIDELENLGQEEEKREEKLNLAIDEINEEITKKEEELNLQIAVLTSLEDENLRFEGVISQPEMDRAFWIWFGGLSLVISIIGTLVAFAGLHLQDERMHQIRNKKINPNRYWKHLKLLPAHTNRLIDALRKRLLNPVKVRVYEKIEVEKIVDRIVEKPYPVEKIVEKPIEHVKVEFQRVEVPKEVIRKEIVYVPFPTNEKGILDKGPYKVKNNKKEYTDIEEEE